MSEKSKQSENNSKMNPADLDGVAGGVIADLKGRDPDISNGRDPDVAKGRDPDGPV